MTSEDVSRINALIEKVNGLKERGMAEQDMME